MARLLLLAATCTAWQAPQQTRQPTRLYRIKNSNSAGADATVANKIVYTRPDMDSATDTFGALAKMCGVTQPAKDASLDFQGFALAFEQLYNDNVALDDGQIAELRRELAVTSDDDPVSLQDWGPFHATFVERTRMASVLSAQADLKKTQQTTQDELKLIKDQHAQREKDWAQELAKAKMDQAARTLGKAKLLSKDMETEKKSRGAYFEAREGAAKAAAQYRSLEPGQWDKVVSDVGGMREALSEIRRRVWTPLCAPSSLLDELGAERLKGVLLYGPPGCGKSYLAKRLAASLSRRPATVVSGPEIIDKYVGSSEAQLRDLFASPPLVPPRPGDAEDVAQVAENNELHVIVLDEFDAIARVRSDGKKSDTATRDSVVNQLLVLMDGIAAMPVPTFVLALTNRRELIDGAILRPGRLEAHVQIPLPDLEGRGQVLSIHAEKMRQSGRLRLDDHDPFKDGCILKAVDESTYGEWVLEVAAKTEGFSGASMAAVVRAAVARALSRSVEADDVFACSVTGMDFDRAVEDVRLSQLPVDVGGGVIINEYSNLLARLSRTPPTQTFMDVPLERIIVRVPTARPPA